MESKKAYLLTSDLSEVSEAYERVGLQIPKSQFFQIVQQKLIKKLEESLPECQIEVIEFNSLTNKIAALLRQLLIVTPEAKIISTVPSIAAKLDGYCLQVNRIVDCQGKLLGIGPRPGHAMLHDQFSEIKSIVQQRSVILVEDGSFTGETMKRMIQICNSLGIRIEHVVAGFLFSDAKKNILQAFSNIKSIHSLRDNSFLDWMPDHDFFPFVPNAGRVVGHLYNGNPMPIYLYNGLSLTMPYVLPYGKPSEWASILADKQQTFSLFCIHQSLSLFEEMESINKTPITLECLISTHPRVSLAVTPNEKGFPSIKTRIIEVLHEDAHMLS